MASSFHFAVANLVLFFGLACSQPGPQGHYCNPTSSIASDSPVSANIKNVLAAMTHASQLNNGFSAFSIGVGANTVFGLANCRGDLSTREHCIPCIQDAIKTIQNRCPNKSDAQIWYTDCIVRYSQERFFGTFDASREVVIPNKANYTDPESLFSRLVPLFSVIIIEGVLNHGNRGMVKVEGPLPGGDTLYGGALCTGDLGPEECARCVSAASGRFFSFCKPRKGCKVFLSSCFARYEIRPFTASLDAAFHNTLPGQAIKKLTRYEFEQAEQVKNTLGSGKSMMMSSF